MIMRYLRLAVTPRFMSYSVSIVASVALSVLSFINPGFLPLFLIAAALAGLGTWDFLQTRHSILRSYPIAGHIRFILENIRPEIRQYFVESDTDGRPFSRNERSAVYERAKGALNVRPFGTELDVDAVSFEWLGHSMVPKEPSPEPFRTTVGGPDCAKPYSMSVFNISAMSFGAISANAVRALNQGAKMGGFAHDTGEGGLSPYHREHDGDIIWEIGSGYFGCRDLEGNFAPETFTAQATSPQVKMIEIKLSQGAKPGHGGVLPAGKVSEEIAETRGVLAYRDCISPARHPAFSTPLELVAFIDRLRRLSGGKPVGFKLCVGHPWEFLGICKAMLRTGIYPDFIVVDGAEGGTGAAPIEFADHVGMPLHDGLMFVHNALVGLNIRGRIKLGASGKITSGFDIVRAMALGADWCNAARGFMFALGCIQAQNCHTGRCPTGIATQDPIRQRSLVVEDKAQRVALYHRATLVALAELLAAAGLGHPSELRPDHIWKRVSPGRVVTFEGLYRFLKPGELLTGTNDPRFKEAWPAARAEDFAPPAHAVEPARAVEMV